MSGHTPGPWIARCYSGQWKVDNADPLKPSITSWISGLGGADKDNARLIAAAPDLLAALKQMVLVECQDWCNTQDADEPCDDDCDCGFVAAMRAIDKAEGK